jgi:hypothetical protein
MSAGLQWQLQKLEEALSSRSADNERLKSAMEVTTLSDMSWLLPSLSRVVSRLTVPLDMCAFKPLMMQLPKVCACVCVGSGQLGQGEEWGLQDVDETISICSEGPVAQCHAQ